LGRRIEKKVSTYRNEAWELTLDRRFVWAGGGTLDNLDTAPFVHPLTGP
jgi:hypothetical protein